MPARKTANIQNAALKREMRFLRAADVMEILDIGQTKAYEIMGRINKELEAEGFETFPGRIPEARFREKFYCGTGRSETYDRPPARSARA